MKIFTKDESEEFKNYLNITKVDNTLWTCLCINVAESMAKYKFSQSQLVTVLFDYFHKFDGAIYLPSNDNIDIYIKFEKEYSLQDIKIVIFQLFQVKKPNITVGAKCPLTGVQIVDVTLDTLPNSFLENIQSPSDKPYLNARKSRGDKIAFIVDDDMFMRVIIKKGIDGKFDRVYELQDGKSILKQYKQHNPDVVFLDIHLPDITGHKILNNILDLDPDAFIIMVSSDSSKTQVVSAVEKGAKGFLVKPFNKAAIMSYLNKCPTLTKLTF